MKVSTDACIQGAWSAKYLQDLNADYILDIGTGTGLLTLLLAQELPESRLLAIEPEPDACDQADENFALSPWHNRIELRNTDLQSLSQPATYQAGFDGIICNPPFFAGQLHAGNPKRNRARHDALPMGQLAERSIQLIRPGGLLSVLYPEREWPMWLAQAELAGWHIHRELKIMPLNGKAANRRVGLFSTLHCSPDDTVHEDLVIYETPRCYTAAFRELLQPYYLYL